MSYQTGQHPLARGLWCLSVTVLAVGAIMLAGGCPPPGVTPPECETAADCTADGNPCTQATCTDGACGTTNLANGTACDDNNLCTETDVCTNGVCAGSAVECPPGQSCDPATGTCAQDPPPPLIGLETDKSMILPLRVQAAFNDDTMFFQLSWEGNRGDVHDQVSFNNGVWKREGWPRRDAQAAIDNDPIRGAASATSTIYESRVTFMLDDPNGPNAVPGFWQSGCMITCHDNSRNMPLWRPSDGEVSKYLENDVPGTLDLWHHRMARSNPIGFSDDQYVTRIPDGGTVGGRFGDEGNSPWQMNDIVDGVPTFAFDPATTGGFFAYPFSEVFTNPMRSFARADSANLGPTPLSVGIAFAEAVDLGYVPQEGDTIPRRRLRQPTGSRGDITTMGTTFTPSAADPLRGRWHSNIQRQLDTQNADDTAMAEGGVYNIAFAVHSDMVTTRDHYVSFAYSLSLDGGAADIQAVRINGSGKDVLPDFSDTNAFPVTELNLFLPGITSWQFLTNQNAGLEFIDPATGNAVDQSHAGAGLIQQGASCRDCHTAASSETFAPPSAGGFFGGAMEALVPQRGGVTTPTPIPPQP